MRRETDMETFEYKEKKYISINGKDYFLIRGYSRSYRNLIYIQVTGKTPLRKEDMPNKEWEILRTKAGNKIAWTGYVKKYFKYNTQRENPILAYLGATTPASYFIALKNIAYKYDYKINDVDLMKVVNGYRDSKKHSFVLAEEDDMGNSGQGLVIVNYGNISNGDVDSLFVKEDDE